MASPPSCIRISTDDPVIMVDDDETDWVIAKRCYMRSKLENEFVPLRSGAELLAHLGEVESGTRPMPALVLLDINMPEMDGFEVLTAVRSNPAFAEIPFIMMLSSSSDSIDVSRSTELGANGYFTKPSSVDAFVQIFDSLAP